MEKLTKTAKVLDVIARVLFWVILASGVVALIAIAAGLFGLTRKYELFSVGTSVHVSGLWIDLPEPMDSGSYVPLLILGAVMLVLMVGLSLYGIRVVRSILSPMQEGKPFEHSVSGDLKKLGWLSLAVGVAQPIIQSIAQKIALRSLPLEGYGVEVMQEHVFDATYLIIALALFLFSYIFRYGEELQRQADETL
mgnify:CR=1 FL=1